MQKAQFNKATGMYDKRKAPAQAGKDAGDTGAEAPAASSERLQGNSRAPQGEGSAPVDHDDN